MTLDSLKLCPGVRFASSGLRAVLVKGARSPDGAGGSRGWRGSLAYSGTSASAMFRAPTEICAYDSGKRGEVTAHLGHLRAQPQLIPPVGRKTQELPFH